MEIAFWIGIAFLVGAWLTGRTWRDALGRPGKLQASVTMTRPMTMIGLLILIGDGVVWLT
jgi:hypothetical protein